MNKYLRIFLIFFCFWILFQSYQEITSHANFLFQTNKNKFYNSKELTQKPKLATNYSPNFDDLQNTKDGNNYFKFAINANGQINRWNIENISVYIPKGEYYQPILAIFETYQKKLNNIIKFTPTMSIENANIIIELKDKIETNNFDSNSITGLTTTTVDKKGNIKNADIQICKINTTTNKKMTPQEVQIIAIHEIAHALGIVGHSPNPKDVMFESCQKIKQLSQRDINTIKLLYSEDAGVNLIKNRQEKLNEAIKYTKKYPQKAVSWLNLGKVYYDSGKRDLALSSYQKALEIEPSNATAYQLIAISYFENKEFEQAIKYYRLGLQNSTDKRTQIDISELIGISYLKLKDYKTAYEYLKTAFNSNPVERNYLDNYLLSCIELDNKIDAKAAIIKYFSVNPKLRPDATLNEILDWAG